MHMRVYASREKHRSQQTEARETKERQEGRVSSGAGLRYTQRDKAKQIENRERARAVRAVLLAVSQSLSTKGNRERRQKHLSFFLSCFLFSFFSLSIVSCLLPALLAFSFSWPALTVPISLVQRDRRYSPLSLGEQKGEEQRYTPQQNCTKQIFTT